MNQSAYKFQGIIPPVVTLFHKDGNFNWEANKQLTDYLINKGVHGLLYMGSTGEFSSLTIEQRKHFAETMVEYVDGRVPVLIGTGTTSLHDTILLSQHAQEVGADGVLVVSPYYWKFSEQQLYDYFTTVADSIDISVLIYNIPLLTGQSLSPELIGRLAESRENIVGVKDTIESMGHIRQLIHATREKRQDFAVLAAFDDLVLPALQLGAAGSINGTSVFAPEVSVELYNSYREGDHQKSLEEHQKIVSLMPIYEFSQPLFLAIKEAVNQSVLQYDTAFLPPAILVDDTLNRKVSDFLSTYTCNNN
jgi:2-dehydro-3-deoxy-D-pentonate aldolase